MKIILNYLQIKEKTVKNFNYFKLFEIIILEHNQKQVLKNLLLMKLNDVQDNYGVCKTSSV